MKKILLFFCLFMHYAAFASLQTDSVINVNNLPPQGILLNKGWKFHSGDNPDYANPGYNDSNWQNIDPTMLIPYLPAAAQHGLGWLRLKLRILTGTHQNTFIIVHQSTALEIYCNGHLITRRGTINSGNKSGRGYLNTDPIELPVTNGTEMVLAVRFAHQPVLKFFNVYMELPIFYCNINKQAQFENTINNTKYYQFELLIGISIFALLAVLHVILFRYNIKNRSNLYFATFTLLGSIYTFLQFSNSFPKYCDTAIYIDMAANSFLLIGHLFLIKALLTVFKFPSGRYFTILVTLTLLGLFGWMFVEYFKLYLILFNTILISGYEAWLILKALIKKRRGSLIIISGYLASLSGMAYYLVDTSFQEISGSPDVISTLLSVLGIPIGMSIYLGREFGLDRQLLEIKLKEVETLSAQMISQEKEKQDILASQNELLENQVRERTVELNQSLTNLKATQTQLIQSEKMASLGELTAGIAHEIQNPLNFINNFSEVNTELIEEMQQEIDNGNYEDVKAIAGDIKENLKKINHHGKRADFIVKGMLQHSRSGSGERQLTNINVLAGEFFKLSFQGLRAKDKSFNAEMVTSFDKTIPEINIVQQDIGRVLLNLFNNAFYAVNQKGKTANKDYKPEVTVTTAKENGQVIITVKDNGIGIPDAIKEKIMQPFFTTKPTGEGTGLGLSLTYDMVVKGHGGSINVNSTEGKGSEFIISLPV
jgi:two-component system NtrC family sensor kinase